MDDRVILRVGTKLMIPFILIFALYVQFRGDYGPGGGFQAGVIFAAAFVLYALVFGLGRAIEMVKTWPMLELPGNSVEIRPMVVDYSHMEP
jgi:multicomponent Na+:H+ antiporter subunit B